MNTAIKKTLRSIGTRNEIASECGVDPIAVYRWGQNGSIPARHFAGVLRVAKRNNIAVTAEYLSDLHDQSPSSGSPAKDFLPVKKVGDANPDIQGESV
ncbi:MAG: hypothetical protein ACPG6L_10640 [Nereida ignava]